MSTVCVTDAELVALARQGDRQAFGELVTRHQAAVYRASMAAVGSPGSDYAALMRGGDRWDFEQATDLASTSNISVTAGVCGGGGCGIVPSDRPGATPGDRSRHRTRSRAARVQSRRGAS